MSTEVNGSIHINGCSLDKEVEWVFKFPQNNAFSPVFTHGNQTYQMRMCTTYFNKIDVWGFEPNYGQLKVNGLVKICLYRMGPSCSFPEKTIRWWAGLKRPSGSYYHSCEKGTLDLRLETEEFRWVADLKSFPESEVKDRGLAECGRLTFFLLLLAKPSSLANHSCIHGVKDRSTGDGRVQVESCQFHMVLHWKIDFKSFDRKYYFLVSPFFNFNRQQYRVELTSTRNELNLYRCGPSEKGSIEWCVGINPRNVFYYKYDNGKLDLKMDCHLLTKVKTLKRIDIYKLVGRSEDLNVVLLLRSSSQISMTDGACILSTNHMLPKADGVIWENEHPSHKEIVWKVRCRLTRNLSSPIFSLGNQHYVLELSLVKRFCLSLNLIRKGPPEEGTFRWWAGLVFDSGTFYGKVETKHFELKQSCEIWTEVGSLKNITTSELNVKTFSSVKYIRFFVRIDKESNACYPGGLEVLGRGEDSFREVYISDFKLIEWDVIYEASLCDCRFTSPFFEVKNHCYMFELCCLDGFWELHLLSSPIQDVTEQFFTFWIGMRCSDKTYNHKIESGKIRLLESTYSWERVYSLKRASQSELEKEYISPNGIVTFSFWVNLQPRGSTPKARTPDVAIVPTRGEGIIEIKEWNSSVHVEWVVDHPKKTPRVTSSEIRMGNQCYLLEMSVEPDATHLLLYRKGPRIQDPRRARCWAGMRAGDGSYYYRCLRGKLRLDTERQTWCLVKRLYSCKTSEVEKILFSQDRKLTVFLRLSFSGSSVAFVDDPSLLSNQGDGMIQEEEGICSKEVEWTTDFVIKPVPPEGLVEPRFQASRDFKLGNQHFILQLVSVQIRKRKTRKDPYPFFTFGGSRRGLIHSFRLNLLRFGPNTNTRILWWAGLKHANGSYYYKVESGELMLEKEYEMWKLQRLLWKFKMSELDMNDLVEDKKIVIFLRLIEATQGASFSRSFELAAPGTGSILQEDCTTHTEIKWQITHIPERKYWTVVSPEFKIGKQRYLLEFTRGFHYYFSFKLYRMGPSVQSSIWCWAMLNPFDSTSNNKSQKAAFSLKDNFELWREVIGLYHTFNRELEMIHLLSFPRVTFFLRLSVGQPWEICKLDPLDDGSIRVEECSSHTFLEWNVHCEPEKFDKDWSFTSPLFRIENQTYLLELCSSRCMELKLNGSRPFTTRPSGGTLTWCLEVAYRAAAEIYKGGECSVKEACYGENEVKLLKILDIDELNEGENLSFSVNFQESNACIHNSIGDGNRREEKNLKCMYVKWNVPFNPKKDWTSSEKFGLGNHCYWLKLRSSRCMELRLYRMGPSVDGAFGSVTWCLGLDCRGAAEIYRNQNGELDLKKECEKWKKVKLKKFDTDELNGDGNLSFSLWLSLQRPTNSPHECLHVSRVMAIPRSGTIEEEAWASCKKMEWQVDYVAMSAEKKILTSPDILIGSRSFILDLSSDGHQYEVRLFRRETTEEKPARWCLGVKKFAGFYDHHQTISGILDFKKPSDVWEQVEKAHLVLSSEYKLDKKMHLIITFVLLWDRVSTNPERDDNDVKILSNSHNFDSGEIVFKAQDKEFKEHLAVLSIRVPALEAMFRFDSVEKRTGVVHIEDCDPITFERFLKYVSTGELPTMPTSETCELFILADKYLMEPLKSRCLREINYNTLCADTICELIELISKCEALDLSESVEKFLRRHKYYAENGAWNNFKSENEDIAYCLETGNLCLIRDSVKTGFTAKFLRLQ